jgi:hypothetical protein
MHPVFDGRGLERLRPDVAVGAAGRPRRAARVGDRDARERRHAALVAGRVRKSVKGAMPMYAFNGQIPGP